MRSGNGLALLLIGFGGLIILGKLGFGLGFLFGLLIPILIILLGVVAWNNGNRLLGGVIAVVGGFHSLRQAVLLVHMGRGYRVNRIRSFNDPPQEQFNENVIIRQ